MTTYEAPTCCNTWMMFQQMQFDGLDRPESGVYSCGMCGKVSVVDLKEIKKCLTDRPQ